MAESGIPIVCTLHPDEMGGRLAEWHRLFATHLAGIERPAPTRLRLLPALEPAGPDRYGANATPDPAIVPPVAGASPRGRRRLR